MSKPRLFIADHLLCKGFAALPTSGLGEFVSILPEIPGHGS